MTIATDASLSSSTHIIEWAPKRRRLATESHRLQNLRRRHDDPLFPGFPDHIAELCLSRVPPSFLYSVCRSWRKLIYSPTFPPFLSVYAFFLSAQSADPNTSLANSIVFSSFDPISGDWVSLPPPPENPPLRLLLRHPCFILRNLPIQSVAVSGRLVLLAATTDHFLPALSRPLIFDPIAGKWSYGPTLAAPRRWCAAGTLGDAVFIASGIGSHYSREVARSVEKWDSGAVDWKKMGSLRNGKFCREAIDAIGWRGKLCMVNVKGDAAKEGVVYNVKTEEWEEMPENMKSGWRGPAAALDEEDLYVVEESRGILRRYDPTSDRWDDIFASEKLRKAEYMAAGGGRVCVVCGGGEGVAVIDVASSPARFWVVDTPPGVQAVALHVLPRMSSPAGRSKPSE